MPTNSLLIPSKDYISRSFKLWLIKSRIHWGDCRAKVKSFLSLLLWIEIEEGGRKGHQVWEHFITSIRAHCVHVIVLSSYICIHTYWWPRPSKGTCSWWPFAHLPVKCICRCRWATFQSHHHFSLIIPLVQLNVILRLFPCLDKSQNFIVASP